MSIFGSIVKSVVGIGKAALSKATMGASDKAISIVKTLGKMKGGRKKSNTMQMQALLNKRAVPKMSTIITTREGAGPAAPGGTGTRRKRACKHGPRRDGRCPPRPRTSTRSAPRAPARSSRARATSTGTRRPPPGGLDFKRMSTAWRAAGQPTSWQDWIKSNPLRRPAT